MSGEGRKKIRMVSKNRKAYHDYHISDRYEAGIELTGSEIKSIRNGSVNLKDGYVRVRDGEAYLEGVHIGKYKQGGVHYNHEPLRPRRLLLKRREIDSINGQVSKKGFTVVPLSLYIRGRWAKVEIGMAKSKKKYDKKQDIIKREAELEDAREMKQRSRGLIKPGE